MQKGSKKPASVPSFVNPSQLVLAGFETPFSQKLNRNNRCVVLAHKIPWDEGCNIYTKQVGASHTGRPPISPRILIGPLITKRAMNIVYNCLHTKYLYLHNINCFTNCAMDN